jgi:hypothetical protein
MFRTLVNITFTQQPTKDYPSRDLVLRFNFCNSFDVSSSWETQTDDGTIVLPKNVQVLDRQGRRFNIAGTNVPIGGFSDGPPLFLRGDKVSIEWGYAYYDDRGNEFSPLIPLYQGFVSEVGSKMPFTLKVQDNMYLLKKAPARGGRNGYFSNYTVEQMLDEMIKNAGLPFTVNKTTSTSLGDFIVQNETISQVLGRLNKEYHFHAYFIGNELRCGSFVYLEQDAVNADKQYGRRVFRFQHNIISDDLEYRRKDDITLSAVATNTIEEETGKTTKDGHAKTKKKRLEVLVTFANGSNVPQVIVGTKDKPLPPDDGGERHTFKFPGAKTLDELTTLAANELRKYYYTGFKGKFTTFGLPYVNQGHNIDILDPMLPERNGRFKVRSVQYTGGIGGHRQVIELDYLITRLDADGKPIGR